MIDIDIMAYSAVYVWLIIAILFLLLEMGHPGLFFFLSFFCGGLVAAVSTFWVSSMNAQIIFFFVGTAASLVFLRYYGVSFISKNRFHERTNVYALQGVRGIVTIDIYDKQLGMIRINGGLWAARSIDDCIIRKGDEVEVIDIKGTHLIVKKTELRS